MGKGADISLMTKPLLRQQDDQDQGHLTLEECNKRMLSEEVDTDVTFQLNHPTYNLGDGDKRVEIKAHKYVLRARSRKFDEIVKHSDSVAIDGVEETNFRTFLRYLYGEQLALSEPEVYQILWLAQEYQVYILVDECFRFLSKNIRDDNLCLIYDMANSNKQSELKDRCLNKLLAEPETFLTTTPFIEMSAESVGSILELDELCIDESLVYDTVVRWAEEKIRRYQPKTPPDEMPTHRSVLGTLLYKVRFPLLGSEFISAKVLRDGLLSAEEITELFQLHLGNGNVRNASGIFTLRSRGSSARAGPASNVVCRFKDIENYQDSKAWPCNENRDDAISVKCNAPISVDGVGVYGPRTEKSGFYKGYIQILVKSRVIQETSIQCEMKKSIITHRFNFRQPVKICGNQRFEIRLKITGPDTYYGHTTYRRQNEDIVGSFHPDSAYSQEGADVPTTYDSKPFERDKDEKKSIKMAKSRPYKEDEKVTDDETEVTVDGIKFKFSNSRFSQNGTSFDEGQIPEIYFTSCGTNSHEA